MVSIAGKARSHRPVPRWHKVFLAMLPQIVAHARIAFRYLKPEARAEAVQEVVHNALKAFVRLVQLQKTELAYPTVLARFGVAQTRDGRKVGNRLNVHDVLSPYCQQRKKVFVERLDRFDEEEKRSTMPSLRLATAPLAIQCTSAETDREERKGEKPSDHAPVIAVFED
jgi:hypothetical protein